SPATSSPRELRRVWHCRASSPIWFPAMCPRSRSRDSADSARNSSKSRFRPEPAPICCWAEQTGPASWADFFSLLGRSSSIYTDHNYQDSRNDMRTSEEFAGLTAIVTGGASGIGRSVTELLLESGAKVAVFDLNPDGAPAGALGLKCDVSDRASVEAAVESAAAEYGGIDIVINNAG